MSVSADMYIVISLMFAVFAAVAAVGTSVVLGAGYERLRAGFEVIRKQTGFFADAIHKLDERTQVLGEEAAQLNEAVSTMSGKVERVEKQTGFFSDAIYSLEQKVSSGEPVSSPEKKEEPILPKEMDYLTAGDEQPDLDILNTMQFVGSKEESVPEEKPQLDVERPGLSRLLTSYFRGESKDTPQEVTYH